MAHNIREHDNMLAIGQRPWHNLGITLDTPPASGEEALRIAKLDWTVEREPLFLGNGMRAVVTGSVSRQNEGQYAAMVRQDTKEILGVVGPGYTPYQNSDFAALFNPLIDGGIADIETCGSLYNGRRVWFLAKFRGADMEIEKGDKVARYLMGSHGHDGTFAMRFGPTAVRIVCANTLAMSLGEGGKIRCLHTKNLGDNLEVLRDGIAATQEHFELTAEQYRSLSQRGVSRADLREYARIIVEAEQDETQWTASQRAKIGKIIGAAVEGRGNNGRTFWSAFNGVTEYLTWEKGRTADTRLDSLWFGDSAKVNQQALDLALQMSA
jgi:phage/plasmid-like protein (TIGR03299 family)